MPETDLPTWAQQMRLLEGVGDRLMATWRPDGATEAETQDMYKLAASMLSNAYLCRVYTEPNRPVFMPLWNYAFNQGGPDPDYVYSTVEIDPSGTYCISGFRGTSRFVEITQQTYDILAPSHVASNAVGGTHDLDDLVLDADGAFRVLLSAERPAGHEGDWWQLGANTKRLLMRKCACDWRNEQDARVAIDRIDVVAEDMTAEETARRMSEMAAWIEGMIGFDMQLVRWYREHHGLNHVMRSTKIDSIGGLPSQIYYDGIYEIDDDEALIVETELPRCRYWQALVADDRFCTVDWVNRQSSLNDAQARVDADGRFRYVVSKQDPGVPNWLDKADFSWGVIQMRFNRPDVAPPEPTTTRVKVADVRAHLPADTPVVTQEDRRAALRARREAAQLRRIW